MNAVGRLLPWQQYFHNIWQQDEPQSAGGRLNLRKYNYHIGGCAAPPGARSAFKVSDHVCVRREPP